MARVTYSSLKTGTVLKPGDILLLYGLNHEVSEKHGSDGYYLYSIDVGNLFDLYGMDESEKYDWTENFGGKRRGNFPWFDKLEDLTRFVIDIYEKSPYKVGDKVRIKEIIGSEGNYPAGFNSGMQKYSGKVFTIQSVSLMSNPVGAERLSNYNGDPHWYELKEDGYTWSSAHFTRVISSEKTTITEEEKKPEVKECPPKYKVGDKVRVKKRVGDEYDYPGAFVDKMLKYEGKVFTVKEVMKNFFDEEKKFFDGDKTLYILTTDDDDSWIWSSPMLEPADEKEESVSCEESKSTVVTREMLEDGYIVKEGDIVNIFGFKHIICGYGGPVGRCWASIYGNLSNNHIFSNVLGISDDKKDEWAKRFGWSGHGNFPEMTSYKALSKFILSIMKEEIPQDEPDSQEHIYYEQIKGDAGTIAKISEAAVTLSARKKTDTSIIL